MRVLGIDPGFGRAGFGVVEGYGQKIVSVSYGCIATDPARSFAERLLDLSLELDQLIKKYQPTLAAVEELFFNKNVKTAMQVAQARGAIILSLEKAGLPLMEFTPLQIKQALVGYGRAEKKQVQHMVSLTLGLKEKKIQDDAADALAVALTAVFWNRKLG